MMKKLMGFILFQLFAIGAMAQASFGFNVGQNFGGRGLGVPNLFLNYNPTIFPEDVQTYSLGLSIENRLNRLFSIRVEPSYNQYYKFRKTGISETLIPNTITYGTRFSSYLEYFSLPAHIIVKPSSDDSKILFKTYLGIGIGYITKLSSKGETFEWDNTGEYINHSFIAPEISDFPLSKRIHSQVCLGMEFGFQFLKIHSLTIDGNLTANDFSNEAYSLFSVGSFSPSKLSIRYMVDILNE